MYGAEARISGDQSLSNKMGPPQNLFCGEKNPAKRFFDSLEKGRSKERPFWFAMEGGAYTARKNLIRKMTDST